MKRKGVAYLPISNHLDLPYVPVDRDGQIDAILLDSINPVEYPILKPFYRDEQMQQTIVFKDKLYQECMVKDVVVVPSVKKEVPPELLIHLLISSNFSNNLIVDFDTLEAWMFNPQLELDLQKIATIMLYALYNQERVLNAIREYLDKLVSDYGFKGLCKLLDHNKLPYECVETPVETFKRLARQDPHKVVDPKVFKVLALELPYVMLDITDGYCFVNAIEYVTHLVFKCKQAIRRAYTTFYMVQRGLLPVDQDTLARLERFNQLRLHYIGLENRLKRQRYAAEDVELLDIEDLGELRHKTAPCILNMLQSEKRGFPSNEIRKNLVATMRKGKLTFATVDRWFQHMFEKDSSGFRTLESRFDHKYYYKKGYAAPNCEKMAKWCPFVRLESQKEGCFSTFKSRNKERAKWAKAHNLYGPSQWYAWLKK